jgi:hypothetical protein
LIETEFAKATCNTDGVTRDPSWIGRWLHLGALPKHDFL